MFLFCWVQSVQFSLDTISPRCSLEGLMLNLKLQYFDHLIWRVTHWKRPWCWEGLGAGGEGDKRGWDGWMASPTRWTWVGVNSGSWWWTGRPGVLQFMELQRVGHDWATELNLTELRRMCSVAVIADFLGPSDYSPPGSSVHGISQARVLEWVATSCSRGSSSPRIRTQVCISCTGRWVLYHWATWEA